MNYPAWTGVQNMPGFNYYGTPADYKNGQCTGVCNGVYQDFATFVRTHPTTLGDVRASRVNDLNVALVKNFHPTERLQVQYRFEVMNALNQARFAAPGTNPASSSFGKVTPSQLNEPRALQMALRVSF